MASDKDSPKNSNDASEETSASTTDSVDSGTGESMMIDSSAEPLARQGESAARVTETAPDVEDPEALELGVQRYVHVAFVLLAMVGSYICGKLLDAAWSKLSDFPEVVRLIPVLIEYTEDERGSITLGIGAVLGVALVLSYYRRPSVQTWATDVATELARVTWPNKETVTNGTIVVIVAGAVATLYVAVLDRFWAYLTGLIYGA
ncbi:MAG: preprotein translocase subunit SecE [Polyangiaceae bacterium]|nr:preprotein translocase subunit SecE [Polyangiaceae bacterium]